MTATEIQANLDARFCTDQWYRWNKFLFRNYLMTDGVKFVCDNAGSNPYWFADLIAFYHRKICRSFPELGDFQSWKIKANLETQTAVITCDDGNNHILITQKVEHTHFPLKELTIWVKRNSGLFSNGDDWVLCIPNED